MPVSDQGIDLTRYVLIPRMAIFLRRGEEYLLLKRAPDKRRWAGKYNGLGKVFLKKCLITDWVTVDYKLDRWTRVRKTDQKRHAARAVSRFQGTDLRTQSLDRMP